MQKKVEIFVGGCNPNMTKEIFDNYFSKFGALSETRLVRDKLTDKFRGFGFVIFEDSNIATNVLSVENHDIMGKRVQLKKAKSKEETSKKLKEEKLRKLFIKDISRNLKESDLRNYFKKFGKIDKVKVVHDKKKNGEEKNYAFVLFKHKDTMTKVLENGSKHDLGIEIVECKQTLLRDELKQKHLEKLQKNKEDSSEGGKKKKKRKRRKRKKKKKTKDTIETKETIEKKMGNQQVEKKKKEKTKKNPINLPQKKFKSTDDVKKIETSLHKNVNKKQNFGSSDNTFESCWMAESQNLSLNYPNNPKKSSISTPFDSDEKEDEKILPHVGESLNQSNPFLNENLKQEWNVSSIQKEKSQKFENGKHNFYPSLTDNSNFGDNFFQRLKKIGDNTEKESEDLAQNFNSGFFDSPSDEVRIEAPPQECQQRNRGHARIWKDCRLPAYENHRKLANFSEAPDQQPHPGFHMYRMVSFETQSELARNSDLSDSNLIQRTRSGLTRLNFSKNKNLSTDNCFNFANMSTDEKNIFGNFDPRNKEDIQRASNMANICNDDAWKRNSFDTRISGINQITKYNDTKKRERFTDTNMKVKPVANQVVKPLEDIEDNFGDFILGFKVIHEDPVRPKSFRIEKKSEIDQEIDYINEELSDGSCGDASELNQNKKKKTKKGCCGMFRNSEEEDLFI